MRIRKSKLGLTGVQWAIFNKTTSICEDAFIFENPLPTAQEDTFARYDAWRTASRQCDIKGTIPDMEECVDKVVSNLCTLPDIS